MGNFLVWVIWILAAAACVGSGIAVVTLTNPFYSALSLIGNLASLAGKRIVLVANHLSYADANLIEVLLRRSGGAALAAWGRVAVDAGRLRLAGGLTRRTPRRGGCPRAAPPRAPAGGLGGRGAGTYDERGARGGEAHRAPPPSPPPSASPCRRFPPPPPLPSR